METADKFINWLEGYLDASKNRLEPGQVREIRKRITSYHKETREVTIPLWDSAYAAAFNTPNNQLNEEFIREVEKNKNASTMEDISAD
jgi:hypothetical protein